MSGGGAPRWGRLLWIALPALAGCVPPAQVARYEALAGGPAGPPLVVAVDLADDPFAGAETLTREALVGAVLQRNPTVDSARQAWRAALERYPQVTALADPTLSYRSAPGTVGGHHGYGQIVQVGQRLPWSGKRALRGAIVLAQAQAREADLERVRVHLRLTASLLYDDHYVVQRALEINREHVALVERLRASAEARYGAGRGSQQDPLAADVELALLEQARVTLAARQKVVIAQLNGLLHRPPAAALPGPPQSLGEVELLPIASPELAARAATARPESRALAHRVDGARAAVSLAEKAYYPDFMVVGMYNSMWAQLEHQFMLGVSINIPLQTGQRRAGVGEATARLARAEAERRARIDTIGVEVRQAAVRLEEAVAQAALYQTRLIPAARRQVAAAEVGYESGRNGFAPLMEAERRLRRFQLEHEEARADTWRRRAALTRAVGDPVAAPRAQGGGS